MNIEIFRNDQFGQVRVAVNKSNEPLFCLVDVCKALDITNSRDAKNRLDEKGVVITDTLTNGGVQKLIFINEPNLYRLIFQSRKDEAKKFQDWIFEEVLPSIRKTGGYIPIEDDDSEMEVLAKAVLIANKTIELKNQRIKELEIKVEQDAPKVDYFDALVDRSLLTNFRDTAKEFKIGQKEFIKWLENKKYIFRDNKKKIKPYMNHVDDGLFEIKEFTNDNKSGLQTLITPKGREVFKRLITL